MKAARLVSWLTLAATVAGQSTVITTVETITRTIAVSTSTTSSFTPFWTPNEPPPTVVSTPTNTQATTAVPVSTPPGISTAVSLSAGGAGSVSGVSVAGVGSAPAGATSSVPAVVSGSAAPSLSPSAAAPSAGTTPATPTGSGLNFGPLSFAGYDNFVIRDSTTAAQIVLSQPEDGKPLRFLTAFPNGNTGALVYFLPYAGAPSAKKRVVSNGTLVATLAPTSIHTLTGPNNQTGVTGELTFNGDAEFGVTLLGSVRTLRDYVESRGTVLHSVFNYTLGDYSNTSVQLVRRWINGSTVQYLQFDAEDNCQFQVIQAVATTNGITNMTVTLPPPIIRILRTNTATNATVNFKSTFNYTGTTPDTPFVPLAGLGADSLFLPLGSGLDPNSTTNGTDTGNSTTSSPLESVLSAIHSANNVTEQMAFLSYASESLAGGWRFLTCKLYGLRRN